VRVENPVHSRCGPQLAGTLFSFMLIYLISNLNSDGISERVHFFRCDFLGNGVEFDIRYIQPLVEEA
jgi:hypothetical protein